MNGDMPHVPITTLAGIASLTDLLNQLPLPSPLPATTTKSLLFNGRIAEEVNCLLACRDENLVSQLVHSLNQVSTDHIELKDNLGSDDPEGDIPVLLQAVLARNPNVFREKSMQNRYGVQSGMMMPQYKLSQNSMHGSPASSNYQQTTISHSPSSRFVPPQSSSGNRFMASQNSPVPSPYAPQSPAGYLPYSHPPSYTPHPQMQQASVSSPIVSGGMRNIHENKVTSQLSGSSANHHADNSRHGSNEDYLQMVHRISSEDGDSSIRNAASFSLRSPQSVCSPAGSDGTPKGGNVSNGQYNTLQQHFSSRSQTNGTDHKGSLYQPIEKKGYGTMKSTSWSSRSAVDLRPNRRVATIGNGVGPKGQVYGMNYAMSQTANSTTRPRSFHERNYRGRQNYDTMSLHSLRLADGPGSPGGVDDHYSMVSEQLDPLAQATLYKNRGSGGFHRSYTFERQMSAGSNAGMKGPIDWMDGVEAPQNRTVIRAPAMRTLQRFQSNNRSRLSSGSFSGISAPQGGVGNSYAGVLERSSRAPSVRSLAESNHHLQDLRAIDMYDGHNTLTRQSFSGGFDDIDLPSAVKYLMANDPNLQVLGAAYIQHKCYSDNDAKKQARSLQAVSKLVKLFNNSNQEVQRHATGAMRNLIYDNVENKLALVEENGIYELMHTLREQDDELRKNVTGILWNLSSSDNLKDRLARDTLEQLTDLILIPLSGSGSAALIQQNASEAEIFYNATGFLRNLSSASQQTRQKMRECHGLVDSMVNYINSSLEVGKSEDKSVENAVCVLRNLSYRLYDEMPPSSLQRLEGQRRNDGATMTSELVGCFSPQSKKVRELYLNSDIVTFTEVSKDPKGMEWLWNPQIIGVYNRLLQRCELNKHTTEAASGALQNITAGDRRWAGVLSRVALEQERILNPVLDRVRTADHHQLRSLTGLIRNLSRNARNKDEMSTKVVSHLIEKLPGSPGDKWPPTDVVVNIIAVLNNLVVESPIAARDIVYFDGLRKLFYIKKKRDSADSEKSSRAASSLLTNMWQYSKLHRDYKTKGYRKEDFVGL